MGTSKICGNSGCKAFNTGYERNCEINGFVDLKGCMMFEESKVKEGGIVSFGIKKNKFVERVRIYEKDHKPEGYPTVEMSFLSSMADHIEALEHALLGHRSDLHTEGKSPCLTCDESAKVLGIDSPNDRCANATIDRRFLWEI
jgi:hypothetical protein